MQLKQDYGLFIHLFHETIQLPHKHQRWLILVGNYTVNVWLEKAKERKPDSCTACVSLHEGLVVSQRVVVEKQPWRDVEGDENVNWVVLVAGEDEEYAETV